MELKEVLEHVEVENYKSGKPCNFLKLLKKADAGHVKAMYDFVHTVLYNELADDDPEDEIAKRQVLFMKKLSKIKAYKYMCIFIGEAWICGRNSGDWMISENWITLSQKSLLIRRPGV